MLVMGFIGFIIAVWLAATWQMAHFPHTSDIVAIEAQIALLNAAQTADAVLLTSLATTVAAQAALITALQTRATADEATVASQAILISSLQGQQAALQTRATTDEATTAQLNATLIGDVATFTGLLTSLQGQTTALVATENSLNVTVTALSTYLAHIVQGFTNASVLLDNLNTTMSEVTAITDYYYTAPPTVIIYGSAYCNAISSVSVIATSTAAFGTIQFYLNGSCPIGGRLMDILFALPSPVGNGIQFAPLIDTQNITRAGFSPYNGTFPILTGVYSLSGQGIGVIVEDNPTDLSCTPSTTATCVGTLSYAAIGR